MDKKAKDELRQSLHTEPPEVTEANIWATVKSWFPNSDEMFKRGIAEVLSNLDRRFRSHDGWKISHRVALSHAFNEWGSWNYHRHH